MADAARALREVMRAASTLNGLVEPVAIDLGAKGEKWQGSMVIIRRVGGGDDSSEAVDQALLQIDMLSPAEPRSYAAVDALKDAVSRLVRGLGRTETQHGLLHGGRVLTVLDLPEPTSDRPRKVMTVSMTISND
jgi:hypothetical protein